MVSEDGAVQAQPSHAAAEQIDWEGMYRAEMPRIYNFFRYRFGNRDVAEELTARTFEKAWCGRSRYRRDLAKFSTWLYTVARNIATDYLRHKEREEIDVDALTERAAGEPGPATVLERKDDIMRLAALLDTLPSREAELVALKYGAGLTNRSIAQLTGLSESNVGTILHRVVQKLKDAWEVGP